MITDRKHVIISGGSKGIGKSLAINYANEGWHVSIIARNRNDLDEAKQEIEQNRKNSSQLIRAVSLDLTKLTFATPSGGLKATEEQDNVLKQILGEQEGCDILINCCGSAVPARFEELTQQQFQFMMDVNYFSAVNLTRLLLPVMKKQKSNQINKKRSCAGHIVFVSSMCGLIGFYGYSAYSASKFALVGLAEALCMELKPYGINVTISFPPDTDTPGYEVENKLKPALTADISKSGSVYSADEVARTIIRDVKAKSFYSTCGFENWLALMASNSFMPTTFFSALVQSILFGPIKLFAYFLVKSWYKLLE